MLSTVKTVLKNFWFIPIIVVTVMFVNTFICRLSITVGSSMEPTLSSGDIVITQITKSPNRYDIIVFKQDDTYLIKRVIGCPGETVQIKDNLILINDNPIKDFVRVDMKDYGLAENKITLGEDEYFVLGDNRNDSKDSRVFGPINKNSILGKKLNLI